MKKMRNFRLSKTALLLTIIAITQGLAQEKKIYNITPDITAKIFQKENIDNIDVYKIEKKEVDVILFEKSPVLTSYYKSYKEDVYSNRKYYEEYQRDKINVVTEYNEKLQIIELINQFMSTKGKYDDKVYLLQNANKIVEKYNMEFYQNNVGTQYDSRYLKIIPSKGKAKKKDLKWIIQYLEKNIKQEDAVCGYKCKEFKDGLSKLREIDSTELKMVDKGKKVKKTFDSAIPVDIMTLSGSYELLRDDNQRIIAQYENEYFKNQIVNISSYDSGLKISKRYPIIRNTATNEIYFIERNNFLSNYNVFSSMTKLPEVLASKGYKVYDKNGKQFIDSSFGAIELTYVLSQYLDENPDFIGSLERTNKKLLNYQSQAKALAKKLEPYSSLYSIKRSNMPTSKINEWRNLTKQAITLLNKIVKTQETYGTFQYLPSYETDSFLDELTIARHFLGL